MYSTGHTTPKFKVGDRVRVNSGIAGQTMIGTVMSVGGIGRNGLVGVKFDGGLSNHSGACYTEVDGEKINSAHEDYLDLVMRYEDAPTDIKHKKEEDQSIGHGEFYEALKEFDNAIH